MAQATSGAVAHSASTDNAQWLIAEELQMTNISMNLN
jgi:hypothetical protein